MSSISSISSLLSSILASSQETSSSDDTDTSADTTDTSTTDTVTLSSKALEMVETLLNSLSDDSTESDDSGDSMYDVLLSIENKKLLASNPELVDMILSTDDSDTTSADAIDLVNMSTDELISIIQKYANASSSDTTSTSSTLVDETV